MDVWSNSDHMNGLANITWNREYEKKEIKYHLLMDDAKRYKFSKQPHVAEDIIPEQLPFALSIQYIKMVYICVMFLIMINQKLFIEKFNFKLHKFF